MDCALTEEGASRRTEEGRCKSACALCRGSAGDADLDISHALTDANDETNEKRRGRVESMTEHCSSRLDRN